VSEAWLGRFLLVFAIAIAVVLIDAATHEENGARSLGRTPPSLGRVECDRVATVGGDDSAEGSDAQPFATVQRLADSLRPGETGCLRAGTYAGVEIDPDDRPGYAETKLRKREITLASYPGERARLTGRLWIAASGVTVANLDLVGVNPAREVASSLTIGGERGGAPVLGTRVIGNNITNDQQRICVNVGVPGYGRAINTLIEANRIHDCGVFEYPPDAEAPPPDQAFTGHWNEDHGIYVGFADHTVIRHNAIYDNASRGVQLYPDAQGSVVVANAINNNGEGVAIGGDEATSSSDNRISANVISSSSERFNVEHSFPECPDATGACPTGNVVRENCLVADSDALDYSPGSGLTQDEARSFYEADGGVLDPDSPEAPYKAINSTDQPRRNVVIEPAETLYVNPENKDFRLDLEASACSLQTGTNVGTELAGWTAPDTLTGVSGRVRGLRVGIGEDGTEVVRWREGGSPRVAVREPRTPSMAAPQPAQWIVGGSPAPLETSASRRATAADGTWIVASVARDDTLGYDRIRAVARSEDGTTERTLSAAAIDPADAELGKAGPVVAMAPAGTGLVAWLGPSGIEYAQRYP
jgi:hypothetical protein